MISLIYLLKNCCQFQISDLILFAMYSEISELRAELELYAEASDDDMAIIGNSKMKRLGMG